MIKSMKLPAPSVFKTESSRTFSSDCNSTTMIVLFLLATTRYSLFGEKQNDITADFSSGGKPLILLISVEFEFFTY